MKLEDLITELEQKHAEVVSRLGTNEFSRFVHETMTKLRGLNTPKEEPKVSKVAKEVPNKEVLSKQRPHLIHE